MNGESRVIDDRVFSIVSQNIYFIPKEIEKFFPDLGGLQIIRSQLQSIERQDLEPFKELQELYLDGNVLEILESDLFRLNYELRYISVSQNRLKFVGENILLELKNLEQAYFHDCGCFGSYTNNEYDLPNFKARLYESCSFSAELFLFHQDLFAIQVEHQIQIYDLESKLNALYDSYDGNLEAATKNLLIKSNELKSCAKTNKNFIDKAAESQKIEIKCVPHNQDQALCNIYGLKIKFFYSTIANVTQYRGNYNDIKPLTIINQQTLFLPSNIQEFFRKLKKLAVVKSGLYEIDEITFRGVQTLTSLILSKNKIIEIPSGTFDHLQNLLSLDLSFNKIENLEDDVFKKLLLLQTLKLNDNLLITINVEAFESLKNLNELRLNQNNLKFISANLLSPMPLLVVADFSGNNCINMSLPGETLSQIETEIIDNCIAPIQLSMRIWRRVELLESGGESSQHRLSMQGSRVDRRIPKTKACRRPHS